MPIYGIVTELKNRSKGRYSSGQRGQTVNLLAYAFTGSNPVLPTTKHTSREVCFVLLSNSKKDWIFS